MTSSNSSSLLFSGVSRWWASPGAQTSTRRSRPASDHTPSRDFVVFMISPSDRSQD
jgi:hypothetical protein